MRGAPLFVLFLALAAALPTHASPSTVHERTVEAALALPTPLGPVTAMDDRHVWEVTVPTAAVVYVEAQARGASPFHLRAAPVGSMDPAPLSAPALRDGTTLHAAGVWRVSVDPAGGANIRIDVTFKGYSVDIDREPVAFEVKDVAGPNPCVVPGACLP